MQPQSKASFLKTLMKQEIDTMREVLDNLHREEQSLFQNDPVVTKEIVRERLLLISRLNDVRSNRLSLLKELDPNGTPSIEQLFAGDEADKCEMLSMRDQMVALLGKIQHKIVENSAIFKHMARKLQEIPKKVAAKLSIGTLPNPRDMR